MAYAIRPLTMVVTTPWLTGWAVLIDTWRLGMQVVYYILVCLILVYCVSNDMTAILSDVLLSAWLAYVYYKVCVAGHVVALGVLVCNAVFGPAQLGGGPGPLTANATSLVLGLVFTLLQLYVLYIWIGAGAIY